MSARILPIIRKEFIHIRRDFRTLVIVFAMPVVMLLMYGYAINMEIQNISMVVCDHSNTPASRELVRAFAGSRFFTVTDCGGGRAEIEKLFQQRRAKLALIIPHDFAPRLAQPAPVTVQLLIDASDSNTALNIRNYATAILQTYNLERNRDLPFEVRATIAYNPALKSSYFFVPALVALILMMISALLTSVTIAREKETGTLEQILVSPVQPLEIVAGKVVPYILLAFVDGLLILLVARFWFDVPIRGSLVLLLVAALLFVFVALALGLLISTAARTQQVAMMAALLASLLPTVMLSGFIFPIASMPQILQWVTYIVPARYFLPVIRGVLLKGNTLAEIWPFLLVLAGFGLSLLLISVRKFKMTLET
ncbi:MAG: ABC transporter permease [candidate division KSB1 bacterium]|nr:ABC transporter permease [candidate division KSB1 bacterium]MDZ7273089.1 ABC transporter permease [candidate division KSB1 bacterium]MDZ7285192.1 ABC transporter permease [candidate division KSB1 bacterium]MDZ7298224.1 ABC transporter permease [candidate division KSB1 bacterium]MDZ7349143.1 ABC transporter permease [candidate division KSB1 bacterium]